MLDLNDDCLREVFDVMELSDLAIVADVCDRFRSIAQALFKASKVKDLTFNMPIENETIIEKLERASGLLRNFGLYAESIEVHGSRMSSGRKSQAYEDRILQLISRHCGGNITKLQLHEIMDPHKFVESIPKYEKLKILRLDCVCCIYLSDILRVCKNLKELTELYFVCDMRTSNVTEAEILELVQSAPKLRSFQYRITSRIACERPRPHFSIEVKTYKELVKIVRRRRENTPLTIDMMHEPIPAKIVDNSVFADSRG